MSQLMQMRQRMKAVETIKKITHAMRLISMSTHSRMKHQEAPLKTYQETINSLFSKALAMHPAYKDPILQPETSPESNPLVIVIGSQKGLCGSFNSALFQFIKLQISNQKRRTIITVGKRAHQFVQKNRMRRLIAFFDTFALHNMLTIADSIMQEIIHAQPVYSSVIIYSNLAPSFFAQKPTKQTIIPAAKLEENEVPKDFYWEQPAEEILNYLSHQYILSHLQQALFQSLLAEHAARFISMDSSTRNAKEMLESLQLNYNKLRQAKITRELTELSSFFFALNKHCMFMRIQLRCIHQFDVCAQCLQFSFKTIIPTKPMMHTTHKRDPLCH